MKKFIIDETLGNDLLNYLGGRPYIEVYPLIQRFQAIPEYKELPKKESKTDK